MTLLLKTEDVQPPGVAFTDSDSMRVARDEIDAWLYEQVDGTVQSGPFQGMRISPDKVWEGTRQAPMLLGCYEEELHGVLERQIARLKNLTVPRIAVIGAAEGYYAVGLKRRLPEAKVYIVDRDDEALKACHRAAAMNGVGLVSGAPLSEVFDRLDLLVMDCEGAEVEYLDVAKFPQLVGVNVIVEIHNLIGQNTSGILLDRFRGSHRITMMIEGARNPSNHKMLCNMVSDYRWMAVSEGRPCMMSWYVMEPKGLYLA